MKRSYFLRIGVLFLSIICVSAYADSPFIHRAVRALEGGGSQQIVELAETVEVAFSPKGGGTDLVVKVIASAKSDIRVAAYSFTSRPVANALIDAKQAGIDVAVVVDHGQMNNKPPAAIDALASSGIPVRIDYVHAIQHNKYIIIDGKTVETGSFNYSAAAESRNAENVIVLWNSPQLAASYTENWKSLWDTSEPYR